MLVTFPVLFLLARARAASSVSQSTAVLPVVFPDGNVMPPMPTNRPLFEPAHATSSRATSRTAEATTSARTHKKNSWLEFLPTDMPSLMAPIEDGLRDFESGAASFLSDPLHGLFPSHAKSTSRAPKPKTTDAGVPDTCELQLNGRVECY